MEIFEFIKPKRPLLVSFPHSGTYIPPEVAEGMTELALRTPDTDWHLPRLYEFVRQSGAGLLIATHSRYVVDLNRNPSGQALYVGADNTELCPSTSFEHEALYKSGEGVGDVEVRKRIERFWSPYHRTLADTLGDMVEEFGHALLFDAHSIRARVPRFFDGSLPDLNLGTADGASASVALEKDLMSVLESGDYSSVCNGRFKGGYITRQYGAPEKSIHAVQLEMVQDNYMNEEYPFEYRPDRALKMQQVLEPLIETALQWIESRN